MARISELHYSNAYSNSSGVSEFLEIALDPGEDPADFTVGFYNSNPPAQTANQGLAVTLNDPGVSVTYDADADTFVYVISEDNFPILLTDPDGGGSTNYEAYALVNTTTGAVINFYDIGGGVQEMTALDGVAAGAVSENLPVPTGPNAATYSLQFNKPDPDTLSYETVDPGDAGAICFASGTQIATPQGPRVVETLAPGDRVLTTDAGDEPIIWTGQQIVKAAGPLAPIEFAPGALGNSAPLRLSPQHRVLQRGPAVELMFARPEILVPAHRLLGLPGVTRRPSVDVTYCHFLLARHRLVWAEGAVCESFYPGDVALGTLSGRARCDLLTRLPDPAAGLGAFGPTARPVEDGRATRALVCAR